MIEIKCFEWFILKVVENAVFDRLFFSDSDFGVRLGLKFYCSFQTFQSFSPF